MTTLANLRTYMQDHGFGDKSDTKALRIYDRAINQAHRDIAQAHRWSFFIKKGHVNLKASATTGTVSITIDTATLTRSVAWTSADVGSYVVLDANTEIEYEITAIGGVGDVDATLNANWIDMTVVVGTYTQYFAKYSLPADFRCMKDGDIEDKAWLRYLDPTDFIQYKLVNRNSSGQPLFFTMFGSKKADVYPYPTSAQVWQFLYYRWPAVLDDAADNMDWDEDMLDLMFSAIDKIAARRQKKYPISAADAMGLWFEKLKECRSVDSSRKEETAYWRLGRESDRRQGSITPANVNRGTWSA